MSELSNLNVTDLLGSKREKRQVKESEAATERYRGRGRENPQLETVLFWQTKCVLVTQAGKKTIYCTVCIADLSLNSSPLLFSSLFSYYSEKKGS